MKLTIIVINFIYIAPFPKRVTRCFTVITKKKIKIHRAVAHQNYFSALNNITDNKRQLMKKQQLIKVNG